MALCLFKCLASCGCRECIIRKLAFYPPVPGYRFEEIEVSSSSTKKNDQDNVKYSPTKNKQIKENISNFLNQTHKSINLPKFTSLQSYGNKHYNLILVYEEEEVLVNDEMSFNIHEKQIKKKQAEKKIQDDMSEKTQKKQQGNIEESQVSEQEKIQSQQESQKQIQQNEKEAKKQKSKVENMKNQTKKEKTPKLEKKEDRFKQVDDLNLICFKKKTRDNSIICGYHIENIKHQSEVVVIYSHGNSTDIGYMINQALDVAYNLRVNVIAYDYSGYGHSTGKPSEKSLIYDLEAMYLYARELGYYPINIVLYGQSIGSGPSTFIASQKKFPIGGIIIHSGFTSGLRITQSQKETMRKTYKKDFFPNIEFIRKINAPKLIIHGTHDEDIKMHHASELYNKAKKNYQPFIFNVEGAGHNNIEHDDNYRRQYFHELREFFSFLKNVRSDLEHNQNLRYKVERNQSQASSQNHKNYLENYDSQNKMILEKDYTQGFPGDGWSESFNHIYQQFFTPKDSLMVNREIQTNDKHQKTKSYEQENNQFIPPNNTQLISKVPSISNQQQQDPLNDQNQEKNSSNRKKQQKIPQNNPEEYQNGLENQGDQQTNVNEKKKIHSMFQNREGDIISDQCEKSENIFKKNSQYKSSPKINQNLGEIYAKESEDGNQYIEGDEDTKQLLSVHEDQNWQENNEDQDNKGMNTNKNQSISKNESVKSQSYNVDSNKFAQSLSLKNTPTHKLNSQKDKISNRMSVPNLNEGRMNGLKNSTQSNNNKNQDNIEDDNIRLHNVTSITRKKQNSMFSTYILDNHGQQTNNKNSQSLINTSLNEKLIQNNSNNNQFSSFQFDESQSNLFTKNKSYSQSFDPSSHTNVSNNVSKINPIQKNQQQINQNQSQKEQKYQQKQIGNKYSAHSNSIEKKIEDVYYEMSESNSSVQSQSPQYSGSIKQSNVREQSISDSDSFVLNLKKQSQNNTSIKSKETLKSINTNL